MIGVELPAWGLLVRGETRALLELRFSLRWRV